MFSSVGEFMGEGCQTIAFVRWKSRFVGLSLKPNGSAVAVVNVGGAVRRYVSWYFRQD